MKKDLLSLLELSPDEILNVLSRARDLKKARRAGKGHQTLKGKSLGLIFEKPSTRTKVSFDVAMYELGGHSVSLDSSSSQLGRGETHRDTGRVLSRYLHGVVIRTFAQDNIEELARGATIPVINGLSDLYHPCQVLTDLFTIQEVKKDLLDCKMAYVGDGNNMANSWILASMILGFSLKIASPKGFEPLVQRVSGGGLPSGVNAPMSGGTDGGRGGRAVSPPAKMIDIAKGNNIVITRDPIEAVRDADVVNTDTWFSMGQEVSDSKRKAFAPYQVNSGLLKHAKGDAIVLHCLPAHRGEEITDDVLDGPQSRVFDQAENRLHVQKAILEMLLK